MRILVVYAHPAVTSFGAAVHGRVLERLRAKGHVVRDLDLYAIGFEPTLSAEEWSLYERPGAHRNAIEDHVLLLRWAEGLVFVYPTWWYGPPAIMKGWLERVWLPGITFEIGEGSMVVPLMRHIRLLGGVSTYGAPWWWTRWVGDPGRRTLMRGLRLLCARRCRTFWLAHYDMDRSTAASRASFLGRIDRRLGRL